MRWHRKLRYAAAPTHKRGSGFAVMARALLHSRVKTDAAISCRTASGTEVSAASGNRVVCWQGRLEDRLPVGIHNYICCDEGQVVDTGLRRHDVSAFNCRTALSAQPRPVPWVPPPCASAAPAASREGTERQA